MYYERVVDPTILVALNEISVQQSQPTVETKKDLDILMDYSSTYLNTVLRFRAGPMQLKAESDALYLVLKDAKSRISGHFYLEAFPTTIIQNKHNTLILTECCTLKKVVCSAVEAEYGGLFHNCQKAIIIRRILETLGHKQLPTDYQHKF